MKFTGKYEIPVPREKVFAAITDPAVLQKVIDGCEKMVRTGEDTFDAHLKVGVAGLKGAYVGKVQLKDKNPPESYRLLLSGKGGPGFLEATALIRMNDLGGARTELLCEAEGKVGGMIAALGSRLIEPAGRKMMDEFFRKFTAEIAPSADK